MTKFISVLCTIGLLILGLCAVVTGREDILTVSLRFPEHDLNREIPGGWKPDKVIGNPLMKLVKEGDCVCLKMMCNNESSFGIKREVKVDIKEYPFLNWKWKATRLPEGGDIRVHSKDDQAAQLYIAFPATGFPERFNMPVISYIWDYEAPKGWMGRSAQFAWSKMRYIVLRNKTDKLEHWYTEKRNIYQDYKKLFKNVNQGEPTGHTKGLAVYINSQHTKSSAESAICDIYFTKS